jgi:hypothetical protein
MLSRRAIGSAYTCTWSESKLRTFRTAIEAELLRHSVMADCCYIYTRHTLKPGRAACAGATLWTDMTTLSERNRSAAQPRPNKKMARDVRPRGSQFRKPEPAGIRHQPRAPQDAQRNYERYLALARAEALTGDPIAAENYFQHAEHYFRSMQQSSS